jgi:hypothetical protein
LTLICPLVAALVDRLAEGAIVHGVFQLRKEDEPAVDRQADDYRRADDGEDCADD